MKIKSFPLRKLLIWNMQLQLACDGMSVSSVQAPGLNIRDAPWKGGPEMREILCRLWQQDEAQDIAEYAVMLAVILVIVVGTIRLIGANANNVFSSVASSIQQ